MRSITSAAIVCCAFGTAGCAWGVHPSTPYTAHANLEMYDRPARPRRVAPQVPKARIEPVAQQVPATSTVGSGSPTQSDIMSARERARQEDLAREQRDTERLNVIMRICRRC
jgi:hypothetical protein